MVNVGALKNPLVILKIVNLVFGILILSLAATSATGVVLCKAEKLNSTTKAADKTKLQPFWEDKVDDFSRDRFFFAVFFGSMLVVWSLVSFLLHLFDVTSKCQTGTVRGMEILAAVFLIIMACQALGYGADAAAVYKAEAERINKEVLPLSEPMGTNGFMGTMYAGGGHREKILKDIANFDHKGNLSAAWAAFCGFTLITLIISSVFAFKFLGTGTGEMTGGAYVAG